MMIEVNSLELHSIETLQAFETVDELRSIVLWALENPHKVTDSSVRCLIEDLIYNSRFDVLIVNGMRPMVGGAAYFLLHLRTGKKIVQADIEAALIEDALYAAFAHDNLDVCRAAIDNWNVFNDEMLSDFVRKYKLKSIQSFAHGNISRGKKTYKHVIEQQIARIFIEAQSRHITQGVAIRNIIKPLSAQFGGLAKWGVVDWLKLISYPIGCAVFALLLWFLQSSELTNHYLQYLAIAFTNIFLWSISGYIVIILLIILSVDIIPSVARKIDLDW